jgi:hypothetical protein
MTPQEIYAAFAFPDSCALGRRVYKKLFVENGQLSAAEKRALSDSVTGIVWQFTLKPTTLPIHGFRDERREYDEIAVLEVGLSNRRAARLLAELVHRTIPYPVLLVVAHEIGVQLSVATKRLSRAESNRVVAEDFEATPWLDGSNRTHSELVFVDSLRMDGLPHAHFLALYEAWTQRIVALACAELSHTFDLAPGRPYAERRVRLEACRALDRQIRSLRASARSEPSFARQVELNTEIETLEKRLRVDVENL